MVSRQQRVGKEFETLIRQLQQTGNVSSSFPKATDELGWFIRENRIDDLFIKRRRK